MTNLIKRYWILFISLAIGIYIGLPFLAPVLMHAGQIGAAKLIYAVYSWQCHQLPERSYFLFGSKLTYSLTEVQNAWQNTVNPVILRQFIGNSTMGWKVAWSDRMVSMYGSLWFFGIVWWTIRSRVKLLPWWGLLLFVLPMAFDGTSHFISDIAGIGQGFRDSNLWLAILTHHLLPTSFYVGDAWGSFNSIMRLLSGILFGVGIVWFAYPYIQMSISPKTQSSKATFTSQPLIVHDNIHI